MAYPAQRHFDSGRPSSRPDTYDISRAIASLMVLPGSSLLRTESVAISAVHPAIRYLASVMRPASTLMKRVSSTASALSVICPVPEGPSMYPMLLGLMNSRIVARLYLSTLLYTSDAADDLLCVDLGGRRI